jgi:hypothetical protein
VELEHELKGNPMSERWRYLACSDCLTDSVFQFRQVVGNRASSHRR